MSKVTLEVTDVKIFAIKGNDTLKANASITLNSGFLVSGLKVIKGKNGLFVTMPQYQNKYGEYKDSSFPLTKEIRDMISDKVLEAYEDR